MIVVKAFCMSLGSCGMAELNLRELLRSLDHEVLMTEGICENNAASCVNKIRSSIIAFLTLGNIRADQILDAQLLACLLCGIDEVEVIGGVLVVQGDEADLDVKGSRLFLCALLRFLGCRSLGGSCRGCSCGSGTSGKYAHRKNRCEC